MEDRLCTSRLFIIFTFCSKSFYKVVLGYRLAYLATVQTYHSAEKVRLQPVIELTIVPGSHVLHLQSSQPSKVNREASSNLQVVVNVMLH